MQPMWAGIAGSVINNSTAFEIAISIHDSVYSTDFAALVVPYTAGKLAETSVVIEKQILLTLRKFANDHLCKFLGAGVSLALLKEVSRQYRMSAASNPIMLASLPVPQYLHTFVARYGYRPDRLQHQTVS